MKKFRKIMAVLVAAMMIMAMMVPAWADEQGRYGEDFGRITITGVKDGESYTVWRMFELASFWDTNNAAGVHVTSPADEAYSYVISESNPWYGFLTAAANGYAALVPTDGDTSSPVTGQLFWIERERFTFNGKDDYHIIYAVKNNFNNEYDLPNTSITDASAADYLGSANASIQKFAQKAVTWAEGDGKTSLEASDWTPYIAKTEAATTSDIISPTPNTAIANVPFGYYLMSTTQGSLCSLDTTNPTVTLYDKNDKPTLDPTSGKKILNKTATKAYLASLAATPAAEKNSIKDIDATSWVSNRDANIGEKVFYRTTFTAMEGAEGYVLHDVMEKGLDFDKSTKGEIIAITLRHSTGDPILIPATVAAVGDPAETKTNWTVTIPSDTSTTPAHRNTQDDFEIHFADEKFYDASKNEVVIKDNDTITVYYSATINSNAILYGIDSAGAVNTDTVGSVDSNVTTKKGTAIQSLPLEASRVAQIKADSDGDGRNTNSTILTYGNNSVTAGWAKANVTIYEFDIVKTRLPEDTSATAYNLLKDAKFNLYKATTTKPDGASEPYAFNNTTYYKDGDALTFVKTTDTNYRYDLNVTNGKTAEIKSMPSAEVNINGLESGEYLLFETEAPYGFNKLIHPIFIKINGVLDTGASASNEGKISVQTLDNNSILSALTDKYWDATVDTTAGVTSYDRTAKHGTPEVDNGGLEIINKAGQELPSTGGMGTTVLYIVGGMLVILAGAYLFFSRKRTA